MKKGLASERALVLLGWAVVLAACPLASARPWQQYSDVTQAGFSAEVLEDARTFADGVGSTAVVAIYRGNVLASWGDVSRPVEIYSVRKSMFSGLFGVYASEGKVDLQATLQQLGIDDEPPLTETEKKAKVVDLLRARSGVYHAAAKEPADMKQERPSRGSHAPGEFFWYNNWDFNTLGPILEKAIGKRVGEAFYERIVQPLQMEDFRPDHGYEQLEPSNSIHPAYAFQISARDLARYGHLFAQKGLWAGRQVIPSAWVAESTSMHSRFPDGSGYGYMWWVHPKGALSADAGYPTLSKYDMFSARGTGGQFLLVIPEIQFVFAHTVDTWGNRHVRGPKVWKTVEMILAARTGEPASNPALTEMRPLAFSKPAPPRPDQKTIALEPAALAKYAGEYESEGVHVRVFEYKGRLYANLRGVGESEILPESQTRFFMKGDPVVIDFVQDDAGGFKGAQFEMGGRMNALTKTK